MALRSRSRLLLVGSSIAAASLGIASFNGAFSSDKPSRGTMDEDTIKQRLSKLLFDRHSSSRASGDSYSRISGSTRPSSYSAMKVFKYTGGAKSTSWAPVVGTFEETESPMVNNLPSKEKTPEGKIMVLRPFTGQLEDGRVIIGSNIYMVDEGDRTMRLHKGNLLFQRVHEYDPETLTSSVEPLACVVTLYDDVVHHY